MDISLRPELEAFINEQIDAGQFANISDVGNKALAQFKDREANDPLAHLSPEELDELRREIQVGIDELDRGEGVVINGKEELTAFFDDIKARGRQRLQAKRQHG